MIRATLKKLLAEYNGLRAVEQWEFEGDWVPRRKLERMGQLPAEADRVSVGREEVK
jgi:hypothetical protein